MRSVLGRNHAATVPLRVRHVLAWQERVFSVRKARICVSEFHSRVGLHFSFVSLFRGLPSPRRLRSARSWSRSHARDTSLLPGPIFRGDACDWASYVAKHAQQARRATRVVRANGQVGVCSDDLGDGLLGRSEGSWEIRKASQRQKRRKGNVCRRGENRRPWKAEGGGLPLCDTCPERALWKGSICFCAGSRMRQLTRKASRPCWAGMDLVSPEDRSHISMLFSVYRYEGSKGLDGRLPSGCFGTVVGLHPTCLGQRVLSQPGSSLDPFCKRQVEREAPPRRSEGPDLGGWVSFRFSRPPMPPFRTCTVPPLSSCVRPTRSVSDLLGFKPGG